MARSMRCSEHAPDIPRHGTLVNSNSHRRAQASAHRKEKNGALDSGDTCSIAAARKGKPRSSVQLFCSNTHLDYMSQYMHESRHKHAISRVRGEKGRFVNSAKARALKDSKEASTARLGGGAEDVDLQLDMNELIGVIEWGEDAILGDAPEKNAEHTTPSSSILLTP